MKMKKKYKVIICLLIIILVIIFLKRDRNYEINYKINNYDVYEKYLKKEKTTYIKVLENRRVYEFVFSKKISKKRRILSKSAQSHSPGTTFRHRCRYRNLFADTE